jgi:hypothetical protein
MTVFLNVGVDVSIHLSETPSRGVNDKSVGLLVITLMLILAGTAPAVAVFHHRWIMFGGD